MQAVLFTTDKTINRLLLICYTAYIILLASVTLDTYWTTDNFWIPWLIQIIPLLLMVPGLLSKRYRSYSWVCFLMLAYFTSYVVQVYSPSSEIIDWVALASSTIVFMSAMYASRLLQRYFIALAEAE